MAVRTKAAEALLQGARINRMAGNLARIAELKAQIDAASAELDALTEVVGKPLAAVGKTYSFDGVTYTLVTPTRTYYDEKGIRDDIGEEKWKLVVVEKMDRDKLAALITAGTVKAELVAARANVVPVKNYILVTRGTGATAVSSEAA